MKRKIKRVFRKLKRNKIHFRIFILFVGLFFFTITGVVAKYITSRAGTASSMVDKVYYTVVSAQTPTENKNVITFYFNVNNYDRDSINEVLMKYYLKINGLNSTVFDNYKLYLKDTNGTWNELSRITTGEYANYFQSTEKLEFGSKKTHNYKLELTLKEHLAITTDYDFSVDLKLIQTQ